MPYVPGRGRIEDVYRSGNVYVNSVPVALWLPPGSSASSAVTKTSNLFANIPEDPPITVDPGLQAAGDSATNAYTSAQTGAGATGPNQYYNATAANDGVKGNYQPTQEVAPITTGTISTVTTFSSIVPFLEKCLQEAAQGLWRETGQSGGASNPNIVGIWSNLGFPPSGMWLTDQTAWCGGFMNFALKSCGYKYVQSASAKAITQNPGLWGATQVPKDQAQPGDIAYWNYSHVNFVYQAKNGKFTFVGGNQSPKIKGNNPNDGDVTESWPSGTTANNPSWSSCWRPSKT